MKILVVCQHYAPEPFRIADICQALVQRGHEVTVVTGTPNYPMGQVYEGYEKGQRQEETLGGVKVHRCKIHPRKTGVFHRLWNYYSYPHASKRYVAHLDGDYDVVFINQLSPVMMAQAGIQYAKKWNKRVALYCLDLWPASLGAGGIQKGMVYRWFFRESQKVYRAIHKLLITSKMFAIYFGEMFDIQETEYLPQYAESTFTPEQCRKQASNTFDFMFAGNVGTAQSVETMIRAAALCKDLENVKWHIVGDGKELENMQALAQSMDAPVVFHGRKPVEEMPDYYKMADAMLVTMQKDAVLSMTLPGKVQSYMAAGKPIIGAIDGETAFVVDRAQCGFVGPAEDAQALSQNIRRFVSLKTNEREALGIHAVDFYNEHFSRDIFIDRLEKVLKEMCDR